MPIATLAHDADKLREESISSGAARDARRGELDDGCATTRPEIDPDRRRGRHRLPPVRVVSGLGAVQLHDLLMTSPAPGGARGGFDIRMIRDSWLPPALLVLLIVGLTACAGSRQKGMPLRDDEVYLGGSAIRSPGSDVDRYTLGLVRRRDAEYMILSEVWISSGKNRRLAELRLPERGPDERVYYGLLRACAWNGRGDSRVIGIARPAVDSFVTSAWLADGQRGVIEPIDPRSVKCGRCLPGAREMP
jgi:hypothetical protein